MARLTPKGYQGPIIFIYNPDLNFHSVQLLDNFYPDLQSWLDSHGDLVVLAVHEVSVEFENSTDKVLAALEKQREQLRAEFQHNLDQLNGKIRDLQALTYQPEGAAHD